MKLLLVGMAESMHTVRYAQMLAGQDWDVHLFPATGGPPHPELAGVTLHGLPGDPTVPVRREERARHLSELVRALAPDIVHSHEMQHSAYLTLLARREPAACWPPWIVTNWGSDIVYFGRDPRHAEWIAAVLHTCDYYSCECDRDVAVARKFGFSGDVLPVSPVFGGFDLAHTRALREPGPTSRRRTIAVKAVDTWVYRPAVALEALARCGNLLDGYRLALYQSPSPRVVTAATSLCTELGLELEVLVGVPHDEILRLHGRSRLSIGLSTTDGIGTSFLEALVMGSFPVQSNGGCAGDWAVHGEGSLLVDAEDVDGVAAAIRRGLTDDELVDRAANVNAATAARLDRNVIRTQVVDAYNQVSKIGPRPRAAAEMVSRRLPSLLEDDLAERDAEIAMLHREVERRDRAFAELVADRANAIGWLQNVVTEKNGAIAHLQERRAGPISRMLAGLARAVRGR